MENLDVDEDATFPGDDSFGHVPMNDLAHRLQPGVGQHADTEHEHGDRVKQRMLHVIMAMILMIVAVSVVLATTHPTDRGRPPERYKSPSFEQIVDLLEARAHGTALTVHVTLHDPGDTNHSTDEHITVVVDRSAARADRVAMWSAEHDLLIVWAHGALVLRFWPSDVDSSMRRSGIVVLPNSSQFDWPSMPFEWTTSMQRIASTNLYVEDWWALAQAPE